MGEIKNRWMSIQLALLIVLVSFGTVSAQAVEDISVRLSSQSKLAPISKNLSEMQAATFSAIHGMADTFLPWLESYYAKTKGQAPADWPFRKGKAYPGLWTSYNYQSANLNHIDGGLKSFINGKNQHIINLKIDLDPQKKILVVQNFDLTDEEKKELASLKVKSVGTPEQWAKWMHGRKVAIQLAAEAGYYGLYLLSQTPNDPRHELIILDTEIITSISKFDDERNAWVPLKK